jgi:hypothetical protein
MSGILLSVAVLLIATANAQTSTVSRQDYDSAFRAMLANPSDLDLTFRYAELAIAVGDLEGAIGAYERLLLINRSLPHIQLALGELYLKLDSTEAARGYLEAARDGADSTSETRERAETILASLDDPPVDQGSARSQFSAYLQLGGAWQSNATSGTTAEQIRAFGVPVAVPANGRKVSDYSAVLSGDVGHEFALPGTTVVESHARFYLTRQLRVNNVNLGVLQVDSGPRFALGDDPGGATVRPYALAGLVSLADKLYQWNGGGGVTLTAPIGEQVWIDTDLTERAQSYSNSASQPRASNANGPTFDGRVIGNYSPAADDRLRLGPSIEVLEARVRGQRYNQFGIEAGWQHGFPDPTGWFGLPWVANLEGNRLWRNYGGPDPTIDARTTRADREWNLDASLAVAVSEAWLLFVDVNQQWVTSNLSNYRFDNTTISLAVGYRF